MRAVFLLILPLAMAGCVAKPSPTNALAGDWRFVEIDEDAPGAPGRARLSIEDGALSATVGCNGMAGKWEIEENRLIAGPLAGTEIYCAGPVWEQEKAVASLLVAAPTIAFEDGRLVLRSSGHSARLERVSPPPPSS